MTYLIIYLFGVIITYIVCKRVRDNNDWEAVIISILAALMSWIGLVVILLFYLIILIGRYCEKNEPPKWL